MSMCSALCTHLGSDEAMCGEVEKGDNDECEVHPQVIGKDDGKCVESVLFIVDFQSTPASTTVGRVTQLV